MAERTLPGWLDRLLRHLLGLPGWVLERLDGGSPIEADDDPDAVYPLVRDTGRHPEAWLALEEGLHHHVDRGLVLGWERRGRTAFAVGGLNAPAHRRQALLEGFVGATRARGLVRQLLFPLRDAELPAARAAGFEPIQVGVEGWLDLEGLAWRGKRYATVRQMRNRARRRGVTVDEVDPAPHREALARLHDQWLDAKRPNWRMKLLVGSPGLERPYDRRYLVAFGEGRIEGFLTVLPGADGTWGVDVMCRRPDAVPGTMELLIVSLVARLQEEGATALSLGPCPMAGVPLQGPRPMLRRIFHLLMTSDLGNRVFGFRSLYAFKDKFRPRWEPVYFGASPHLGVLALYRGCRMWGLY